MPIFTHTTNMRSHLFVSFAFNIEHHHFCLCVLSVVLCDHFVTHFIIMSVACTQCAHNSTLTLHRTLYTITLPCLALCCIHSTWYVILPPLLAPIYHNRTVMTVPIIDGIDHKTFEYRPVYGDNHHYRG